jgi:uncharacterized protein YceH (UPF0502 family)
MAMDKENEAAFKAHEMQIADLTKRIQTLENQVAWLTQKLNNEHGWVNPGLMERR